MNDAHDLVEDDACVDLPVVFNVFPKALVEVSRGTFAQSGRQYDPDGNVTLADGHLELPDCLRDNLSRVLLAYFHLPVVLFLLLGEDLAEQAMRQALDLEPFCYALRVAHYLHDSLLVRAKLFVQRVVTSPARSVRVVASLAGVRDPGRRLLHLHLLRHAQVRQIVRHVVVGSDSALAPADPRDALHLDAVVD